MFPSRYFPDRYFAPRYFPQEDHGPPPTGTAKNRLVAVDGTITYGLEQSYEDRRLRSLNPALSVDGSYEDRRLRSLNADFTIDEISVF